MKAGNLVHLTLHFLGPFQAALDGIPIEKFDSNKVRALLVYLAMERNRPHSREVLAGMFWPEQSQRSAMDNLRYVIADLRRTLEDPADEHHFLIVSRDRIQMNPASDIWLDVIEFERLSMENKGVEKGLSLESAGRLQEAINLYQGGFLEGFTVARSAPFEEWMINRREQLHREMVNNLYLLADHYERWGEFQPALNAAWKQVELEPWQEEAHQQIMRLLAFDGKRSSALQQYETCKNILANELGVGPSEQTQRLYESIRDGRLFMPYHFSRPPLPTEEISLKQTSSPFFAREDELQLLDQCLQESIHGESQVLFVMGEAGSGKTTLVNEFIRRSLRKFPDLLAASTNCNAFTGSSDPYLPFVEILSMLSGDLDKVWIMGSEDREAAARLWSAAPEAVQALSEGGPDLIGRLVDGEALLARARAVPNVNTVRIEKILQKNASSLSQTLPGFGSMRQSALFEQTLSVFKRIAHHHSLIIALDDLQWADADTINLLFFLCRRLGRGRLMILGMFREEELRIDANGKSSPFLFVLRELQTSRICECIDLSQSDGRHFIECLVDSEPNHLGMEFRARLERATSGLPLFSIELLRAMQARGDLVRNECGEWIEGKQMNWDPLPPQVEAVIADQVDRLPAAWQMMLEVASVEGDDFTAETVARVLCLDPQELSQQLSSLITRHYRIISATGVQQLGSKGAHLSYFRFRHHLFQKYFYFRQDIVQRTQRHERVGFALEAIYGEQVGEYALPLAQHFEQAGLPEKAAAYLLQAGKKALSLFAFERAIDHFQKGLELLDTTAASVERDQLELSLLTAMSGTLITTEGYTSSNLERVFSKARILIDDAKNNPDIFGVLTLLKSYYNIRGDPRNSQEIANQILKMARRSKNTGQLVLAHSRMVANCLYYAQWEALQKHLKQTIQFYDIEKHREITYQIGSNPKANALSIGALGYWIMGYPEQAYLYCQAALDLAEDLAHPIVSWFANYYAVYLYGCAGDFKQASNCVEKMLRICNEQELDYYRTYSQIWKGWLLANASDKIGLDMLDQGTSRLRQVGDRMNLLMFLRFQANACLNHNLFSQALELINEALELSENTQIIHEKPELIRLKGEILLAESPSDPQQVGDWFFRAIECAIQQKSKMWELRATASLARLRLKQGKGKDAHRALSEIYGWFTEGNDSSDLKESRILLAELN
jgi:DNA-binding SARP family transcriptional activator/predicted ATPase